MNEELGYNEDPELFEDNEEGAGDETAYNEADTEIEYDHSQFESPEEGDDE